ncbi:hypothetical protein ACHAW6_011508 [Cyclotella cf. meneghiniana]
MSTLDFTLMEDPWSTFRLPVPVAKHVKGTKCPFELPSYCTDEWIQRLTDLLRLLDVMKKSPISQERESTMKSQIVLARSMMNTIECHFVPCLIDHRTTVDSMEEHELNFHANVEALLNELRRGTRDVCQKYQESMDLWKSMNLVKTGKQRDFIAEIFLLPEDQSPLLMRSNRDDCPGEFLDDYSEDSDGNHEEQKEDSSSPYSTLDHKNASQRHQVSPNQPPKHLDPIEFQKQQQHLLEEELSTLASRLKSSTLAMNATLQSQTRDLDDFESLAQENLDVVSSTTQKVQDRLIRKKGWKKRLATWSLIATVLGMWVFCFMVIRTVPKRKIGTFSFHKWRRKSSSRDDDEYVQENIMAEAERRRWDIWRERKKMHEEDQKRRWKQQQQQNHHQPGFQQQQSQQQQQQQCEILSDGTQVCSDAAGKFNFKAFTNSDRKAQQLLAERKRNRIEKNMANAPLVNATDSLDDDESEHAAGAAAAAAAIVAADEAADEEQRMKKSQRRGAAKQAAVENEAREAKMKDSAEEREQAKEAERHRQIERELDRVAEEAAEAKRRQIEQDTNAAKETLRLEEGERLQQDEKAAEERAAAEEKRRLEEAKRLRQIEEDRLLKEAAAAAEMERLERERLEAIKHEKLLAEQREKENVERVRKEALEEANVALQLAKHVNLDSNPTDILPSDVRFVAGRGKNDLLAHYITTRPDMIDASDGSGWRPIHEAARGGNRGGVQLLIDLGCDLGARTGRGGNGGTALWWAIQRYGEEHDVVRLLRSHGAPSNGPDS